MVPRPVIYRTLRLVEKRTATPLAVVCAYEAVALTFRSKRTPPITVVAHKHKWVFPLFSALLGLHIWFYDGDDHAGNR